VPIPEDERFETYLKQFRPLAPDALPIDRHERAFPRYWVLGIAGAAAVLILSIVSFLTRPGRLSESLRGSQSVTLNAPMQALTMRDANALLATAPSYKAALDELAFHRQRSTVAKDKQSGLAVLAKEKIKL